jgi:hypothetical protein
MECLQLLIAKLQKIQRGLSQAYQADHNLRDALINAYRGVEECRLALFNPAPTFEGVCDQLRSAIGTVARERESAQFNREPAQFNTQLDQEDNQAYDKDVYDQHWTDRTYEGRGRGYGRGRHNQRGRGHNGNGYNSSGYSGNSHNGMGYRGNGHNVEYRSL